MSLTATCGASERAGGIVIRELVPQDGWSCADAREIRFHYQWVPGGAACHGHEDHRRDSEREPATSETPADSCAPLRIRKVTLPSPTRADAFRLRVRRAGPRSTRSRAAGRAPAR